MVKQSDIWRRRLTAPRALLALLLACNYFAYRVELFPSEEEHNHPLRDPFQRTASVSAPTLTWETFDKDDAPKAVTLRVWSGLGLLAVIPVPAMPRPAAAAPVHPIRDKSPPPAASPV